jgi:hypothetical protein
MLLADGLYLIKNRLGSPGDAKTLVTGAFNNRNLILTDITDNFAYVAVDYWADWGNYKFVQDDDAFYVTTHNILKRYNFDIENCNWTPPTYPLGYGCPQYSGGCLLNPEYNVWCRYAEESLPCMGAGGGIHCKLYGNCVNYLDFDIPPAYPDAISSGSNYEIIYGNRYDYYTFPTPAESGDIISVAVWAEVRGQCALSLNLVYGENTSEMHQFEWESLVYTEKPAGGAWAWSDLESGTLKAGVKCYRIPDKNEFGTCRRLKVVITTTTGEITLWPSGDYVPNYIYHLQPVCGNYLEDLEKGQELADSLCEDSDIPPALFRSGTDAITTDPCITSDLSEVAPRFSVINSINVFIKYSCNDATGSLGYIRPFIEINGTKYYGDSESLNTPESYIEHTLNYTWSINPATSAAWDYDDYKAIKFGCHAHLDDSPANGVFIFQLYATTTFQERHFVPEFTELNAQFVSFREEAQTPRLIAPDLRFLSVVPLAERLRVMYVHGEMPRFVGFVWSCQDQSGVYAVIAKGYQEILKYRYLPNISYSPRLDSLSIRLTMNDILSADPPTHPLHSHIGQTRMIDSSLTSTPSWVGGAYTMDRIMVSHESFMGLFWMINSYIPAGHGDSTGKIPGLGTLTVGRPVFGCDRQIAQIEQPYTAFDAYWENEYTYPNIYESTPWPIFGPGSVCGSYGSAYYSEGFQIDGIRRLAKYTSSTCDEEEYYPSSDGDLYVMPWPDSQLIYIDYAMDTFIDLDENDAQDKYLNEPLQMLGAVDSILSNIFELSGQEVIASPGWDGRLHLSAKVSNRRGSEASPIFAFLKGINCEVETVTASDPPFDAAIGYDIGSRAVLDLQQTDARFCKVISTNRTGEDLEAYLNLVLDSDTKELKITAGPEHSGLRPLDWISVNGSPARIRAIEVYPEKTIITAGKQLADLNESFGEWLNKSADSDMSQVLSSYEFEDSDYPISHVFWVKASDYKRSDWQARLTLSWDLTVPNDATVATLTETPKAWITIEDKVIAPGKILLSGKSGSVVIDISDACIKSTTEDTDQTLKVYLEDHMSQTASPTFYHTITCKIEQFRVAAVLENA